jgi:hypothetical protein
LKFIDIKSKLLKLSEDIKFDIPEVTQVSKLKYKIIIEIYIFIGLVIKYS